MKKEIKSKNLIFCIPASAFRKKALSLGMTEEIFCELYSKQMVCKDVLCPIGQPQSDNKTSTKHPCTVEEAKEYTRRVFHPTKEEEIRDKEYCQELVDQGVDFEKLQEGLSSKSLFKDFLALGNSII